MDSTRFKVGSGSVPIPKHEWKGTILKNEDNKNELNNQQTSSISKTPANNYLERDMSQCMSCTINSFLLDKLVLNQCSTVSMSGRLLLSIYNEIVVSKRDTILTTLKPCIKMEADTWYKNKPSACTLTACVYNKQCLQCRQWCSLGSQVVSQHIWSVSTVGGVQLQKELSQRYPRSCSMFIP